MFVVELIYKAALADIDAAMAAHMTFLKKYYTSGNFLMSGRKIPRTAGSSCRGREPDGGRSHHARGPVLQPRPR